MADFWELNRPRAKPKTTGWLVAACMVVAVWSFVSALGSVHDAAAGPPPANAEEAAGAAGFFFGSVLTAAVLPALVVWLVLYFGIVRTRAPERGGTHAGILAAVALVIGLSVIGLATAANRQKAEVNTALAELRGVANQMADPKMAGTKIETTPKSTGEMGKVEGLAKGFLAIMAADRTACMADLKATGYPDFMRASSLGAPGGLSAARAGLKKARSVTGICHRRFDGRFPEFRQRVAQSNLNDQAKSGMLAGMDRSLTKNKQRADHLWWLQGDIYDQFEAVVDGLETARGRWRARDGKILFVQDSDLAVFREHMNLATSDDAQMQRIQAAQLEEAKKAFAPMP